MSDLSPKLDNLKDFYVFYLNEHSRVWCRIMHYIGSSLVILILGAVVYSQMWIYLLLIPVAGYGFAWVGHFFIEKNRPATFQYPFYSLLSDWIMYFSFLTGQLGRQLQNAGVKKK